MTSGPETLDGISLFSDLGGEERAAIARQCRWRRYGANEQIIDRQSESREVFFVIQGRARVIIYSYSGREVSLDDIDAGGFFGELSALDGAPRSASVMAIEPALVAVMGADAFNRVIHQHISVATALLHRLTRVIRSATDRIVDLSTLGANNRVQAEILRRALGAPTDEQDNPVISPIPIHAEVASRVSTTRETVARVMSDLSRKGILRREKETLVVTDIRRLEVMVAEVTA